MRQKYFMVNVKGKMTKDDDPRANLNEQSDACISAFVRTIETTSTEDKARTYMSTVTITGSPVKNRKPVKADNVIKT